VLLLLLLLQLPAWMILHCTCCKHNIYTQSMMWQSFCQHPQSSSFTLVYLVKGQMLTKPAAAAAALQGWHVLQGQAWCD
jgi:hypothetical protein